MNPAEAWLPGAEAHRLETGRPLVTLSYAQSLDGCLTYRRGQPLALSGPQSQALTHRLRAAHTAILVGIGTVLADDPQLNVRLAEGPDPQPVILDSRLRFPPRARLLAPGRRTPWIATLESANQERRVELEAAGARLLILPPDPQGRVALPALLEYLARQGVNSLMVEGGAQVITGFLARRLANWAVLTIAPLFIGGLHAVESGGEEPTSAVLSPAGFPRLRSPQSAQLGEDLIVWGRLA
ncbi:MAG TPA: RibD family protein [Anaerolineales bacterium]